MYFYKLMISPVRKRKAKLLHKAVLKSVFEVILYDHEQFKSLVPQLNRLSKRNLRYIMDDEPIFKTSLVCLICQMEFENKLVLLIHLELFHDEDVFIRRY